MKTRMLYTRFWQDEVIQGLSLEAQHLYVYLLTCPHINLTAIFQLTPAYIKLECKLSLSQIKEAKKELQKKERVFFYKSWVYIPRADKYNKYSLGEKTGVAYIKELEKLPAEVLNYIHTLSIPYRYPIDTPRNKKEEIRNKKSYKRSNKSERRNKREEGIEKIDKIRKKYDFLRKKGNNAN